MLHYFLFYKPFQVLSQFSKVENKKTLADFFINIPKDVYPVGRLDFDSEGLILLSNDKKISHQLLEPKFAHQRTYFVQVEGNIENGALVKLQKGVTISVDGKNYQTKKAIAKKLNDEPRLPERMPPIRFRKNIPTSWIALTLTEGKNRQVRKMTAAVGYPTLRLVRYSIGNINIDGWQSGEIRSITELEATQLLIKG